MFDLWRPQYNIYIVSSVTNRIQIKPKPILLQALLSALLTFPHFLVAV